MTAPWYDTEEGIRDALSRDLQGFTDLYRERATAGYDRRERLAEWIVLGHYVLDACGNSWPIDELAEPVTSVVVPRASVKSYSASMRSIAPPNATCERCGHTWTLRDAHDYRPIRGAGVDGTDVIHMHAGCRRLGVADQARADITAAVRNAGIEGELLAVHNRYGSEDYAGPWFVVNVPSLGRVTIGWRKRVVQITWEHGPDGRFVFADDEVTCAERLVHAWHYGDVTSYLRRLLAAVERTPSHG